MVEVVSLSAVIVVRGIGGVVVLRVRVCESGLKMNAADSVWPVYLH
jgi:hypothetical protein